MGSDNSIIKKGDDEYHYECYANSLNKYLKKSKHKLKNETWQTNYYDSINGKLTAIIFHINYDDEITGITQLHDSYGKIFSEYTWANKARNGPYKLFYREKITERGNMKMNAKHGIITEYTYENPYNEKNDKIKSTITTNYENGIKHGACKFYDSKDILIKTIIYEYGNEIDKLESMQVE
jgi:antitoxin component YwqK of YwqJK toxin-antitoxin module